MKESQFIKQSEKKWKNFEEDLKLDRKNPERTSKLFIQITDDLSYARTFYPNRMVRKYLDGVSQLLLGKIYKNQRTPWSSFISFWTETLPLEVYRARRTFTISFLIFLVSMGIGMLSSYYEPEFARVILGDSYVNMTIENIENDDPMAVYKQRDVTHMFTSITMNNIAVAFWTFVFGVLAAIGSIFRLIYNGVMVGAFQYFFIEKDVFWESFLTIWQHGTIEISAIIIAGAAGITLGKGLIFTGSYSRLQAFKISGQRGLTIFLGTIPLFIIAGFIEGFLTRDTDAHPAIRIAVIVFSALFIFYYFGWYPRKVGKQLKDRLDESIPVEKGTELEFEKGRIFSVQEIVLLCYGKVFSRPYLIFFVYLVAALAGFYFTMDSGIIDARYNTLNGFPSSIMKWLDFSLTPIPPMILAGATLIISVAVHCLLSRKTIIQVISWQKLLLASVILLPIIHPSFWLLVFGLYPIFLSIAMHSTLKGANYGPYILKKSLPQAYSIFGLVGGLSLILFLFLALFNELVMNSFIEVLIDDAILRVQVYDVILNTACYGIFLTTHLFASIGIYYLKYSIKESQTAFDLIGRIELFRKKHKIVGE